MFFAISTESAIDHLAPDPLRNIVLLKQRVLHPGDVQAHRVSEGGKSAILLALDASAGAHDPSGLSRCRPRGVHLERSSDLTAALRACLPRDRGVVFKLSRQADLFPVESKFFVERCTAFAQLGACGLKPVCTSPEDEGGRFTASARPA
jgi:hypothetical protein